MATAKDAIQIARSLLNDDLGTRWSDAILLPKLQIAHRELQADLELNSIPVTSTESIVLTVPAGATNLGVTQPADLIEPLSMMERDVGGSADDFDEMIEVAFIPQLAQDTTLLYWCWQTELIKLLGATTNREVLLRYTRSLTVPATINSDIGFIAGELFLGARIAYLASGDERFDVQAQTNLDKVIRANVKGMQGLVRRRRPYQDRRRSDRRRS